MPHPSPASPQAMLAYAQDLDVCGDAAGARTWVEHAAATGFAPAQTQYGLWLIKGRNVPTDIEHGKTQLSLAAKAGDATAAHLLINLHALAGDWDKAVAGLIRLAKSGDADACIALGALMRPLPRFAAIRRTLYGLAAAAGLPDAQFLLGSHLCMDTDEQTRKLGIGWIAEAAAQGLAPAVLRLQKFTGEKMIRPSRQEVNTRIPWAEMKRFVQLPHEAPIAAAKPFLSSPKVDTIAGFLEPHLCDYLIVRGLRHLSPATVHDAEAGEIVDASRNNSFANFRLVEADIVTLSVDARILRALGHSSGCGDPLSLLQYKEGQTYAPHYDFFDSQFPAHMPHLKQAGQRCQTALVYLNDEFEGGHTRFHKADASFRGTPGDLVAFANISTDGKPDLQSLHSGEPPAAGIKWILSKWTREAPLPL